MRSVTWKQELSQDLTPNYQLFVDDKKVGVSFNGMALQEQKERIGTDRAVGMLLSDVRRVSADSFRKIEVDEQEEAVRQLSELVKRI